MARERYHNRNPPTRQFREGGRWLASEDASRPGYPTRPWTTRPARPAVDPPHPAPRRRGRHRPRCRPSGGPSARARGGPRRTPPGPAAAHPARGRSRGPSAPARGPSRSPAYWANSFSWTQDVPGEDAGGPALPDRRGGARPRRRRCAGGCAPNLDVALRVPLQWRGGGTLDGFIDWWHRFAHVPDGERPLFLRNAFRVEGDDHGRAAVLLDRRHGDGARQRGARDRATASATAPAHRPPRLSSDVLRFPTGTGPFAGHGLGGGGQLVADLPLSRSFDLYAGTRLHGARTRARFGASSTRPCGPTPSSLSSGGPGDG